MATNTRGAAQEQAWTDAFVQNDESAFESALAADVRLQASALVKPVIGRDLVKAVMAGASAGYEHLVFIDQAKNGKRTWLEWEARTFSGLELSGVTVLTMNDNDQITEISIHHRPLLALLKFSAELGDRVKDKVDRSHFYQPDSSNTPSA